MSLKKNQPDKILYMDEAHNYVDPEVARWMVTHKHDETGVLLQEIWVDLKKGEVDFGIDLNE